MAAYSPGLKVVGMMAVTKDRLLPLPGSVRVKGGDRVEAETVVASTQLPGNAVPLNVAQQLGCEAAEVNEYMRKKLGDAIEKGDKVAETPGLFGFFKSAVAAPVAGCVESISNVTGQMIIRESPLFVEVKGYISGIVDEVFPGIGVRIVTPGCYIQGIFGLGGETGGPLEMAVAGPDEILDVPAIQASHAGKILVGGAMVTAEALKMCRETGVNGLIIGGMEAQDLKNILGGELGVGITGAEDIGITLILTEGFGRVRMAERTFSLLKHHAGKRASLNGATQIRAGVIRPEIIIPLENAVGTSKQIPARDMNKSMSIGSPVRVIRQPHFGEIARVVGLPVQPVVIATEALVRVVEIQLTANGETLVVPRANVELIEE
ncbi:MAG: hypothetical protein WA705_16790 [Candidatus Ozemobacteraceae bacterium]